YQIRQLQQHQIPVVLCHRGVQGVRAPVLAFNGRDVGRLAGEAMLRKGHRNVAFLSTFQSDLSSKYEQGLRSAFESAGASIPPERVIYTETDAYTDLKAFEERVDRAIGHLLAQTPRPTALFATFDDVTELVFLQLIRRGVAVPGQMS